MKKLMTILLALTMTASLAACGGAPAASGSGSGSSSAAGSSAAASGGDAAFTTVEEGKLHMATNAAFPPYEMTADGEGFNGTGYEGIDVEIASAIADKLGLELVVDDMDFTSVVTSVQSGKEDIAMAGLTVNEERLENVNFTDSYATGVQVVIVKEGSDVTIDNLGEKMIGTQEGTTGWSYCSDDYGDDHVTAFTNGATAIQALLSGSVDCVVIDNEPAKAYVAANDGLAILDTEYVVEDYAIGVSKENNALLDAINAALKELISDGTVQNIIDTYITAE